MIDTRYKVNLGTFIHPEDQTILLSKTIGVIGCGGNGGYIAEFLCRLGVKKLILWDGDVFEESNLNRQFGSSIYSLNESKAKTVAHELKKINPNIEYIVCDWYLGTKNDSSLLNSCDLIVWAADSSNSTVEARELVRQVLQNGVPVIDGCLTIHGGRISIIT